MKISDDPIGAAESLQFYLKKYVTSAFGTNSEDLERERKLLLDTPGVFFQEPFVEVLPEYETGKRISELDSEDLPGMSKKAISAFRALTETSLVPAEFSLYSHQQ